MFLTRMKMPLEIAFVFGLIATGPVVFAADLRNDSLEQQSSTTGDQPVPAEPSRRRSNRRTRSTASPTVSGTIMRGCEA